MDGNVRRYFPLLRQFEPRVGNSVPPLGSFPPFPCSFHDLFPFFLPLLFPVPIFALTLKSSLEKQTTSAIAADRARCEDLQDFILFMEHVPRLSLTPVTKCKPHFTRQSCECGQTIWVSSFALEINLQPVGLDSNAASKSRHF